MCKKHKTKHKTPPPPQKKKACGLKKRKKKDDNNNTNNNHHFNQNHNSNNNNKKTKCKQRVKGPESKTIVTFFIGQRSFDLENEEMFAKFLISFAFRYLAQKPLFIGFIGLPQLVNKEKKINENKNKTNKQKQRGPYNTRPTQ